MKKNLTLLFVIYVIFMALNLPAQERLNDYYTIPEVYTIPDIIQEDTFYIVGYYTDSDYNLLVEFYGSFDVDQPFTPHSTLTVTGAAPPADALNGGFVKARGTLSFIPQVEPYHPEDSLMAVLDVIEYTVIIPGSSPPPAQQPFKFQEENIKGLETPEMLDRSGCDPCKFAFLLSGGINGDNNHAKYWENLVTLYKFKVDSLGYCDSNVFVHYYQGTPRDGRIPAGRVIKADSAKIDSTMKLIARRVAACTRNGTPATFQKMITNHGDEAGTPGEVNLLGDKVLTPDEIRAMQQPIIDSCCRTIYDEFLECFAGHVVDAVSNLDNKNKTTIYINSAADKVTGHSPHGQVHPYLQGKINALDSGKAYEDAVVAGKLAYDAYLQQTINTAHNNLMAWRATAPGTPNREAEIAAWLADSTERAGKICKSRNVTIVPFTTYCQWKKFVVPPGGQLVVDFAGASTSCGNVTVYRKDPVTGALIKVAVWNWNHPGSAGYQPGNERRAINTDGTGINEFWIHNDNDTSRLQVQSLGSPIYPVSPSNISHYPGFSFGGTDNSSAEFFPIPSPGYFLENIDQLDLSLQNLPANLGSGFVQNFGFSFQIDHSNPYWTSMKLILRISNVLTPGTMIIQCPGSSIPFVPITINAPGQYIIPIGDFSNIGNTGTMSMLAGSGLRIALDSWGLKSAVVEPPLITTAWLGLLSSDWTNPGNWSGGVPGLFHNVVIGPGPFEPVINNEVVIKSLAILPEAVLITSDGGSLILTGH